MVLFSSFLPLTAERCPTPADTVIGTCSRRHGVTVWFEVSAESSTESLLLIISSCCFKWSSASDAVDHAVVFLPPRGSRGGFSSDVPSVKNGNHLGENFCTSIFEEKTLLCWESLLKRSLLEPARPNAPLWSHATRYTLHTTQQWLHV